MISERKKQEEPKEEARNRRSEVGNDIKTVERLNFRHYRHFYKTMDPIEIISEFYIPGSGAFDMLVRHGRQVAEKAVAAAEKVGHLNPDMAFIEEAAVLHDIGIFLTRAPGLGCTGDKPYLCHGVLGRELLEEKGILRHALVCERHVGTGISTDEIRRAGLPLPCRDMLPLTLEEEIICYADKFFSKSTNGNGKEKPVSKILQALSTHGEDKAEKFMAWHSKFG